MGLLYVNIWEVQYSCTRLHIHTPHITICCGDGIISNTFRHTQYILFTYQILRLTNGTVYILSCDPVIQLHSPKHQ